MFVKKSGYTFEQHKIKLQLLQPKYLTFNLNLNSKYKKELVIQNLIEIPKTQMLDIKDV